MLEQYMGCDIYELISSYFTPSAILYLYVKMAADELTFKFSMLEKFVCVVVTVVFFIIIRLL